MIHIIQGIKDEGQGPKDEFSPRLPWLLMGNAVVFALDPDDTYGQSRHLAGKETDFGKHGGYAATDPIDSSL